VKLSNALPRRCQVGHTLLLASLRAVPVPDKSTVYLDAAARFGMVTVNCVEVAFQDRVRVMLLAFARRSSPLRCYTDRLERTNCACIRCLQDGSLKVNTTRSIRVRYRNSAQALR